MRLGLYQTPSPAGDVSAGYGVVRNALSQAANAGVDMLVLPELFLPGYNAAVKGELDLGEDCRASLSALASDHGVGLAIGFPEVAADGRFNSAVAFDGNGNELGIYRKIQLFGPGEGSGVFVWRQVLRIRSWRRPVRSPDLLRCGISGTRPGACPAGRNSYSRADRKHDALR